MYAGYFGLKREPFSIAPDPHYLFMSERHREALAHLLYGLGGGGGFVLLTGEIGTGKTTLCRLFLEQIPKTTNVAYIFNPKLTVTELLQSICDEFGIAVPLAREHVARTVKDYLDPLNAFLLQSHAAGRNNVLVIDEAQNLAPEVLEQLRLLTNLETNERKLLQVILIGQPELREMLERPDLEQLAQRVIARYHLGPLTEAETAPYVQHRLEVAGLERPLPFDPKALRAVHAMSRGVPRRINLLCDRALLGAYATSRPVVDAATVKRAAQEVFGNSRKRAPDARRPRERAARRGLVVASAGVAVAAAALYVYAASYREAPELVAAVRPVKVATPAASAVSHPLVAGSPGGAASAPRPPIAWITTQDDAWRQLAREWKVADLPSGEACTALSAQELQCFDRPLTLPAIRELGRPGIIRLDASSGSPRYALLVALGPDSATLRGGDGEETVPISTLATRWQGDFATLWRSPPGYASRAATHETSAWTARAIAQAEHVDPPEVPRLDLAMRTRLKAFQLSHGLPADGQPGPLTFMQLNRATGVDEPRLRPQP